MIQARRVLLALGVSLLAAPTAWSQTSVTAVVTADHAPGDLPGVSIPPGYAASPFTGTINGTEYSLNCVDFFHDALVGVSYGAWQVNLGALMGNNALLAFTRLGTDAAYSVTSAIETYEKVAYLASLVPGTPSSDPVATRGIQTAIWELTGNYPGGITYLNHGGPVTPETNGYIALANANGLSQSAAFYASYNIVSDKVTSGFETASPTVSRQELMFRTTSTPEPASIALLGTGLVAIGGFAKRRRRSA